MNFKLPIAYYEQPDVVALAKGLIGKYLCTAIDGLYCAGMIVETEAYCGATDKACHAHFNRRTKRTETMWGPGGHAYIYLCYGIHSLFNIVTNVEGKADAVLVRAVEPEAGLEHMMQRRKMAKPLHTLTAGPGAMSQAMGIQVRYNGISLGGDLIWIEDRGPSIPDQALLVGNRVGIAYAKEDAHLPWRFRLRGNLWVSRAKGTFE